MATSKGGISIEIDVPRFRNEMGEFERLTERRLKELTRDLTRKAFQTVKRLTPVRTGTARDGWKTQRLGQFRWLIFNNVSYIRFLEHGRSKEVRGVHMVRRTTGMLKRFLRELLPKIKRG